MSCDKVTEEISSEDRGLAPVKRRIIHHKGQMWSVRCPECPESRETSLRLLEELDDLEIKMIDTCNTGSLYYVGQRCFRVPRCPET